MLICTYNYSQQYRFKLKYFPLLIIYWNIMFWKEIIVIYFGLSCDMNSSIVFGPMDYFESLLEGCEFEII